MNPAGRVRHECRPDLTGQGATRPASAPDRVDALPLHVVREVLWHFGDTGLGQEPGGFVELLLRTMSHADRENFSRLALVFPQYADAFHAVARVPEGLERLRDRAKAGI